MAEKRAALREGSLVIASLTTSTNVRFLSGVNKVGEWACSGRGNKGCVWKWR